MFRAIWAGLGVMGWAWEFLCAGVYHSSPYQWPFFHVNLRWLVLLFLSVIWNRTFGERGTRYLKAYNRINSVKGMTGGFVTYPTSVFYADDIWQNCSARQENKSRQTVNYTDHRCSSISDFLILQLSQFYEDLCRWMLNFQHLQNSSTIIGYCHVLSISRTVITAFQ